VEDRYVLPDQLTFHAAVFSGCIATELISIFLVWFMIWAVVLGVAAFAIGILVVAPMFVCTLICFFITVVLLRRFRNNRPPGALGQLVAKSMDRMGFMPCRFIVETGALTASRSRQLVGLQSQLINRLPVSERSALHDIDPNYEDQEG